MTTTEIPDPDTRVEFLQTGMKFFHLGEWHTVKSTQKGNGIYRTKDSTALAPRRYVTTEDERTFVMYDNFLVATDLS